MIFGLLQFHWPHCLSLSQDKALKTTYDPKSSSITTKMCDDALQQDVLPDAVRLDTEASPEQQKEITLSR